MSISTKTVKSHTPTQNWNSPDRLWVAERESPQMLQCCKWTPPKQRTKWIITWIRNELPFKYTVLSWWISHDGFEFVAFLQYYVLSNDRLSCVTSMNKQSIVIYINDSDFEISNKTVAGFQKITVETQLSFSPSFNYRDLHVCIPVTDLH